MSSIYTVGQVNAYIKKMFVQDFMLNRIAVTVSYTHLTLPTNSRV